MNRKIAISVLLIVFAVTAFSPGIALAGKCGKGKGSYSKGLDEKILKKAYFMLKNQEELGLSDEQVNQLKDFKIGVKKQMVKQKADIKLVAIDIRSEMHDDTIDTGSINKLMDKKYDLKKEKAKYLIASYATLKGILTDEQKEELKSLYKKCDKK